MNKNKKRIKKVELIIESGHIFRVRETNRWNIREAEFDIEKMNREERKFAIRWASQLITMATIDKNGR